MPETFDFQTRAGYPLAIEDRSLPLFAPVGVQPSFDDTMRGALASEASALDSWARTSAHLQSNLPEPRKNIRIIRAYDDTPVIIVGGWIAVSVTGEPIDHQEAELYCSNQPDPGGPIHCVPLSRFAPDNQNIGAIFVGSRNIIVKGTSRTHGLSLVLMSENLVMSDEQHDIIDLSAPEQSAPTLGNHDYIRQCTADGGTCTDAMHDIFELESNSRHVRVPGSFIDLQWQYERARQVLPDHEWTDESDPCKDPLFTDAEQQLDCRLDRDARGLAGLAGGAIFAMTHRINGFNVRSVGQPGGDGGEGYVSPFRDLRSVCGEWIQREQFNPCTGWRNASACMPNSCPCCYSYDVGMDAYCHGDTKFPSDGQSDTCLYACDYDRSTMGHPGGHAGPGGASGLATLVAITATSVCNAGPLSELTLREEGGSDSLDVRCIDGKANDRAEDLIDCDSPFCSQNPDVTVCPPRVPAPLPQPSDLYGGLLAEMLRREPRPLPSGFGKLPQEMINPKSAVAVDGSMNWVVRAEPRTFLRAQVPAQFNVLAGTAEAPLGGAVDPSPVGMLGMSANSFASPPSSNGLPTNGYVAVPEVVQVLTVPEWAEGGGVWPEDAAVALQEPGSLPAFVSEAGIDEVATEFVQRTGQALGTSVRYDILEASEGPNAMLMLRNGAGTVLMDLDVEGPSVAQPDWDDLWDKFPCVGAVSFEADLAAGAPGTPGQGSLHKQESCPHLGDDLRVCVSTILGICDQRVTHRTCRELGPYREARRGGVFSSTCNQEQERGPSGSPVPTVLPFNQASAVAWKRGGWANAVDKLLPLEWSRRIGQADSRYKSGFVAASSAPYLSVLNALQTVHLGACGEGITTGDQHIDYLCGLDADIRRHLSDRIHFRNYYGYPSNFIPPVAARTHRLRELLNTTLDQVALQEQRWVAMGSIASVTTQMATERAHDLDVEKCELIRSTMCANTLADLPAECRGADGSPAPVPDGCGVLKQQQADANLLVDERRETLKQIKANIAQFQWSQSMLQDPSTTEFDKAMSIAEAMATAGATAAGGPIAGLAADSALRGISSVAAKSGKEKIEEMGMESYPACLEGDDANTNALATCTSKANAKEEETKKYLAPDGATWSSAMEKGATAAGKKAFEELISLALGGDSDSVQNSLERQILDATIREWMWRSYEAGLELGRAVRQRDIVRAKFSAARARVWQLQADQLAVRQASVQGSGTLPPVAIQLQIADAAFRAATRVVERAGEHVFLYRRAVERDTLPFDEQSGESRLAALERQELASNNSMLYAACQDVDVDGFSLNVSLRNWPCYRMWSSWLDLFAEVNGSNGTSFIDRSVPVLPEDFDPANHVWRIPVHVSIEDVKAVSATWGAHTRARLNDMFVRLDTTLGASVTGAVPVTIERGPENIFYLGPQQVMFAPNASCPGKLCPPKFVDRQFNVDFGKRGASDALLLDLLMSRSENYRHEMHACHAQGWNDPSADPFCWASNNTVDGETWDAERAWFAGESLVGTLIVEVPQSKLDQLGTGVQPTALQTRIVYDYRYQDEEYVSPTN